MYKDEDFPPLKNDLIIRTAFGEVCERVPVWIMRQAGRYLPEFREIRSTTDFLTLIKTSELASIITIQPIDRYDGLLDAAIIFSDILVILELIGYKYQVISGEGIKFEKKIEDVNEIDEIINNKVDVCEGLNYVFEAITITRKNLNGRVPLIGFSGAPFTLFCYLIEGQSGVKSFSKTKEFLYNHNLACHKLFKFLSNIIATYLIEQVKAGAQLLQLFDTWSGILSPNDFIQFVLPYLQQIAIETRKKLMTLGYKIPLILFCKGAHYVIDLIKNQDVFDVISLDWTMDPIKCAQQVDGKFCLQGNMDPCVLFANKEYIKNATKIMLEGFGSKTPLIANLGHGMLPNIDPDHLKVYLQSIKEFSTQMRKNSK